MSASSRTGIENSHDSTEDTIVAVATGPAEAGVAIVRLSGPAALSIFGSRYHFAGKHPHARPRHLEYGTFLDADASIIDHCLGVTMPGPHSFTGEDVAEIHCHGGRAVIDAVIDSCISAGARLAEPGEFSKRAYLNGRMDMAQAEALADLISARTQLGRRMALRQLQGGLSERVATIRTALVNAAAEIEAHLDFPEEDIPALAQDRIAGAMATSADGIDNLLQGHKRGRYIKEGVRVVLAGKPNAGKSRLFNALIGRERALVSPHPGTTRDTIEATVDIAGLAVTFVDTAGIRDSADEVEQMGIARTSEEVRSADLVLQIVDATAAADAADQEFQVAISQETNRLQLLNKTDLVPAAELARLASSGNEAPIALVSAATGEGITEIEEQIKRLFVASGIEEEALVTRARHAVCLQGAQESLQRAREAFDAHASGEFIMVDLREALLHLGEITGERLDEQILDRIFSTFCLGK